MSTCQYKYKITIPSTELHEEEIKLFRTSDETIQYLGLSSYTKLYNLLTTSKSLNKTKFKHSNKKHLENIKIERLDLKGTYPVIRKGKKEIINENDFLNDLHEKTN